MKKVKNLRNQFIGALIVLVMAFTSLLGTTFAWFTDSVTSAGNIIQSGKLDVEMYWANGNEAVPADENGWKDASRDAIFNYDNWEPGYADAKHIKIVNAGSLAFRYRLSIIPNGEASELAEVIDVYYIDSAAQIGNRDEISSLACIGTLADIIEEKNGVAYSILLPFGATPNSELEAVGEKSVTIVFKMRDEAGNEYQGLSIGTDFSIQLIATQYTYENDSFDNLYDENITLVTTAEELKDAITSGKTPVLPDGSLYEEPEDSIVVWNTAELTSALKKANNGKTVFMPAGSYTLPQLKDTVKDITVVGTCLAEVTGMTVYKTNVFNNFTFEDLLFTGDVKGVFYGNCIFKNCDFVGAGIARQSKVNKGATLTVENCTFNDCMEGGALWFQGTVSTVNVRNCEFDNAAVAMGKSITFTLENCDFKGTDVRVFGPITVNDSTFDSACIVGPVSYAEVNVEVVMNGCVVDNGADIKSICYYAGNTKNVEMKFVIDGTVYTTDQVNQYIAE